MLTHALVALHGRDSLLAVAVGRDGKGRLSVVLYAVALAVSGICAWLAVALYVLVAILWLIPDRRIEDTLARGGPDPAAH